MLGITTEDLNVFYPYQKQTEFLLGAQSVLCPAITLDAMFFSLDEESLVAGRYPDGFRLLPIWRVHNCEEIKEQCEYNHD